MDYINKIICGDNLSVMKTFPNKKFNLIIADPPYNINKADWDKIPDYIKWLGIRLLEMQRVLKDNGSFYLFHNDFLRMVEIQNWINKNTKFIFKQLIVWNKIHEKFKNSGFVQQRLSNGTMRNYYSGFTEYILFYTFQDDTGLENILPLCFKPYLDYMKKQKENLGWSIKKINSFLGYATIAGHWFHIGAGIQPRFISYKDYEQLQTTGFFQRPYEDLRKEYESLRLEYEDLRNPFNISIVKNGLRANSNVWLYPPSERNRHITPKPIELIKNILRHSSNEDDIILIPFVGSGNDCIACKELKRNYIGIENKKKYVEIAKKRIKAIPELLF